MVVTQHAKQRMIERTDFVDNFAEAKRKAKIAWHSGATIADVFKYCPRLAEYMTKKKERNGRYGAVRYYKGNIYIWKGKNKNLVTSFPAREENIKEMEKGGY